MWRVKEVGGDDGVLVLQALASHGGGEVEDGQTRFDLVISIKGEVGWKGKRARDSLGLVLVYFGFRFS